MRGRAWQVGGKEDDLVAVADTNTDPQEAKEFAELQVLPLLQLQSVLLTDSM